MNNHLAPIIAHIFADSCRFIYLFPYRLGSSTSWFTPTWGAKDSTSCWEASLQGFNLKGTRDGNHPPASRLHERWPSPGKYIIPVPFMVLSTLPYLEIILPQRSKYLPTFSMLFRQFSLFAMILHFSRAPIWLTRLANEISRCLTWSRDYSQLYPLLRVQVPSSNPTLIYSRATAHC